MQTLSTEQLVGQNIGGYVVKSLVGQSRINAVYLAHHPTQRQVVALTTFRLPEQFSREAHARFRQRFTNEATVLSALSHRNLLPILGYGEHFGYSYLITPYMTNGSLADILKQREYCAPHYVLDVLEQVAAGVGYAHRKGVVHGTLKLSNILIQNDGTFVVAGFGLAYILQRAGIEPLDKPYVHLTSIADTFLYASTTIAPEVVQGQPIDQRSDTYALGVMLFEMLSGTSPFTGSSPFDTAMQHVQHPLPSLRKVRPEVPIATELVVNHALARDPDQRFQRVSDLVEAFAQTCGDGGRQLELRRESNAASGLNTASKAKTNGVQLSMREENGQDGPWQLIPPIVTGKMSVVPLSRQPMKGMSPLAGSQSPSTEAKQALQQLTTDIPQIMPQQPSAPHTSVEPVVTDTNAMKTPDWWIQTSTDPYATVSTRQSEHARSSSSTETVAGEQSKSRSALRSTKSSQRSVKKRSRKGGRRKVVALLVTGSVAAVGVGIAAKMNLGHLIPSTIPQTTTVGATTANGNHPQTGGGGNGGMPQPTTPPSHTGTVVGTTDLAVNAFMGFLNPVDGKPSLLIHLPNGKFVAYERACTHQGVSVNYDSVTHKLVCPAHGAIFDPANNAAVLQGPAATPLAPVIVHVNADGTITT